MAKRGRPKRIVELTPEQRDELGRWTRRATTAQALALRARVVTCLGSVSQRLLETGLSES